MADEKVYVVCGETGEYSNAKVWYVRSFLSPEPANAFRDRLNKWCEERGLHNEGLGRDFREHGKPPEDPHFCCDYTGTSYGILEIPLEA